MYFNNKENMLVWEKQDWNDFHKGEAKISLDRLNEEEIGNFIFVKINKDENNNANRRVFIDSVNLVSNILSKNGIWNTFTLASDIIKKRECHALAIINYFRKDSKGYLLCNVSIIKYFNEFITEEKFLSILKAILYFRDFGILSKKFISATINDCSTNSFNSENLIHKYPFLGKTKNFSEKVLFIEEVFRNLLFLNDEEFFKEMKEINDLLSCPTLDEVLFDNFISDFTSDMLSYVNFEFEGKEISFSAITTKTSILDYPITLKKVGKRISSLKFTYEKEKEIKKVIQSAEENYNKLLKKGKIEPVETNNIEEYFFSRLEAVNSYYEEKKLKEKEERKKNRKNKS